MHQYSVRPNHYFALVPIPKPKPKMDNTFGPILYRGATSLSFGFQYAVMYKKQPVKNIWGRICIWCLYGSNGVGALAVTSPNHNFKGEI